MLDLNIVLQIKKILWRIRHHDPGGYVIINGNEKAIIAQEKVAPNIVQVFENSKQTKKYGLVAEIRSVNDKVFTIPKLTSVKMTNSGTDINYIRVAMHHIKTETYIHCLSSLRM